MLRRFRLRRALSIFAGLTIGLFLAISLLGSLAVAVGSRGPLGAPPQRIASQFQNVTFTSRGDGIALSGWLFHSPKATGRSVILVHGWHGNREDVDFVGVARMFLSHGYDVLMFDLRGSGRSGGMMQTFANDEPRDVLGAHDFMIRHGYRPSLMTVLGNSMGAATVIETAPQLTDVAALICDSSYTDVTSAMENGLTDITGLPGFLAVPALEFSRIWGIDPSVSPIAVVKGLRSRSFLFIQSQRDHMVAPGSAALLRDASMNAGSQLLIIDGHSHLDTYGRDPSVYTARVLSFISSQIAQRG